ncbi:hypothetical protein BBOU_0620 [Bifidobacterium boum]|uniref:Uncharacterized protein n=1 Tax=Bifidobacterium boum TaxID=78343 RepID=A0A086ZPP1_9BIFI|nr:hypothetical protein BBOU_0620 [Bifidobacterium boum]
MRGEHNISDYAEPVAPGSSPHARGTLLGERRGVDPHGIIPACAGNTVGQLVLILL